MFAALDAGCSLAPWWRSGQLDRLLDEDHAALTARAVEVLRQAGWQVDVEVTFSIYGERGSIDVVATRPAEHRALIGQYELTKGRLVAALGALQAQVVELDARALPDRRVHYGPWARSLGPGIFLRLASAGGFRERAVFFLPYAFRRDLL